MPFQDRFRPDQIACPIMRARIYRDIRRQTPRIHRDSWIEHTIAPGERLMPELVAYRVYQNWRFKWVVLAAAGLDDYRNALEPGDVLRLPTVEWLRDRFRYYAKLEAVDVTPPPVRARATLASDQPALSLPENQEASSALQAALQALAEPTPLVSASDEINDDSLNRQRNAIDAKLDAIRDALAKMESK